MKKNQEISKSSDHGSCSLGVRAPQGHSTGMSELWPCGWVEEWEVF